MDNKEDWQPSGHITGRRPEANGLPVDETVDREVNTYIAMMVEDLVREGWDRDLAVRRHLHDVAACHDNLRSLYASCLLSYNDEHGSAEWQLLWRRLVSYAGPRSESDVDAGCLDLRSLRLDGSASLLHSAEERFAQRHVVGSATVVQGSGGIDNLFGGGLAAVGPVLPGVERWDARAELPCDRRSLGAYL